MIWNEIINVDYELKEDIFMFNISIELIQDEFDYYNKVVEFEKSP